MYGSTIVRRRCQEWSTQPRRAPVARLPALILHVVVEGADAQHAHRMLTEDVKFPPQPETG